MATSNVTSCAECSASSRCVFEEGSSVRAKRLANGTRHGFERSHESGEYIAYPAFSPAHVSLICHGLAALFFITEKGDETLLHALGPGMIIGLSDCLQQRPISSIAARAVTNVRIRYVTIGPNMGAVAPGAVFANQIGVQLETVQRASLCMRSQGAYARVAFAIHELVRILGLAGATNITFPHRIPRWFLASYTALSPETVSRTLTRLQKEGLIAFRKRRLVVVSLAGLERLNL